ncbi:MAG: response regulator transcription factor [Ignavibacteriae bacterium]|nr:response regulator transcription factor [Ignavibacteriota bacterium]
MINILIVDDHTFVREGIKYVLKGYPDIKVLGEASSGQEALEKVKNEDYDVIVLDITMTGKSGLDVLKDIKRLYPKLPVLILSMHPEDQFGIRILQAGASGYITKQTAPTELILAIRKVFSGGKYLSPSLAEKIAFHLEHDSIKAPHEHLSDREFQIMRMLSVGKTVTEIAQELSLSVKTVSTHRTHIIEKMKMQTNAELTGYSKAHNLID